MAAFATFENRTAVVTGGASGIGRELVLQLVRRGTHVAVCDVDGAKLEAAARRARVGNPAVRVSMHLHDVADEAAVGRLVQEVALAHGGDAIHLLFNNAGVVGGGSFVVGSRDAWERTFAVCWFGTYHCTRAFLPMLLAADQAVVVNISSVSGLWASLGGRTPHTAYASARLAAVAILVAVGRGDWRVVIGQDAEAVDARVRADPWTVYG